METYTTTEALSFFPTAKRKCYQDDTNSSLDDSEFQPKYFNRNTTFKYTLSNCLYASMIEKILTNCSCTPNFAIIGKYLQTNQSLKTFITAGQMETTTEVPLPRCQGESLSCVEVTKVLGCKNAFLRGGCSSGARVEKDLTELST